MQQLSKSKFKEKALEVMRTVESTGEPVLITDRGNVTLELKPYTPSDVSPLDKLKGSVVEYIDPLDPVGDDDWDAN